MNTEIELNAIRQDYNEKLMKSESDKFSTLSSLYDAEANLTKMQNELTNYIIRNNYYYVAAPQDGYITNSFVQGVGEIVKEGAPLVSVVPKNSSLSVEFYIDPIDMPLVHKNMRVQLTFDGWPAFVFSGWPGVSFGTYTGKIVAIDRNISPNGKFRVLAIPDKQAWPESLQVGGGVKSLTLLNNVPVVYEIWRKINGFPPEFYESVNATTNKSKTDEKNKFVFLVLLVFVVLKKQGQERIIFNYENYIDNILKNNPVSLVGENTGTYGRLKYKAARGNYDPMMSGTIQQKQLNNVHYYTAVQGEVKQPLFTSQYLKLGYEYGQGSFINPEQYTSSSYGLPYVGIEVGLLQGMLFDKRRAEVLNARHQVNYYEAERKILINELLYESSIAYFDWLFSKRQYNLFNYFYSLAQQRFDAAVELAKYGERPAIDTLEADILLQSRLLDMRAAEIENIKQFAQITSYNWNSATEAGRLNKEQLITDSLEAYFDRVKEKIITQYVSDVQTNP